MLSGFTVGRKSTSRSKQSVFRWRSFRKVLGLESVKDASGNIIQEAPLPVWANFRQRALDTAIAEINKKTDLNVVIESLGRSKHRRVTSVTFAIKEQAVPKR
jgi:Initiator Replication protein